MLIRSKGAEPPNNPNSHHHTTPTYASHCAYHHKTKRLAVDAGVARERVWLGSCGVALGLSCHGGKDVGYVAQLRADLFLHAPGLLHALVLHALVRVFFVLAVQLAVPLRVVLAPNLFLALERGRARVPGKNQS